MIISVLTENTAKNEHYKCEHGLCLHIATEKHKIRFDTGATALFRQIDARYWQDLLWLWLNIVYVIAYALKYFS